MDGVWRIDICIAMSLPELSSGEQKLSTVGTLKQTISWWYNSSDGRKS